jgi:hypothetical protein
MNADVLATRVAHRGAGRIRGRRENSRCRRVQVNEVADANRIQSNCSK